MVELVGRVRAVGVGIERRGLDEPGVALRPHLAAELAGDHPSRVVDRASRAGRPPAAGCSAGASGPPRSRRSTASRSAAAASGSKPGGRSDRPVSMMWWPAEWSFDACVSDRTSAQRWLRCASTRQVLADRHPRRARGDRPELAADVGRRFGLEVEALVLRQSPREEDVDDRPSARASGRRRAGRLTRSPQGAKGVNMLHTQPEQPDGPGLEREVDGRSGDAGAAPPSLTGSGQA